MLLCNRDYGNFSDRDDVSQFCEKIGLILKGDYILLKCILYGITLSDRELNIES